MRYNALILLVTLSAAASAAQQDRFLEWMNRTAQHQLDRREAAIRAIRTTAEAGARQREVRAKILELLGGLPDYNGPLNARVTGRIERPRYVIEKVIFESLPQYFVTGNLYRPRASGRYPGVLVPMGHWLEGKAAAERIAANLAMKGFVVLAYDPVGQGERLQAYDRRMRGSLGGGTTDQHTLAGAQCLLADESFARFRIWDARRALDYLASRPEVETDKIGCTGCSGGGTLTTYISALDARIKVAAPACYMSTLSPALHRTYRRFGAKHPGLHFFRSRPGGLCRAVRAQTVAYCFHGGRLFPRGGCAPCLPGSRGLVRALRRKRQNRVGSRSRWTRHAGRGPRSYLQLDDPLAEKRPRQSDGRAR